MYRQRTSRELKLSEVKYTVYLVRVSIIALYTCYSSQAAFIIVIIGARVLSW